MTVSSSLAIPLGASATADRLAPVRAWLWCLVGLVFAMVLVGGATRLTESGLSITEWKPLTGVLPPLSDRAWQDEFLKYQQIPQFAALFPDMTLAGFKFIFFWEWSHRLLGRVIGLAVLAPLVWFWIEGRLDRGLKIKLVGILVLLGLQGAVGWWMVASGLSHRIEVAPERLATHMELACLLFVSLVSLATGLVPARAERVSPGVRRTAFALVVLVLVQIGLGSLMAGSRAGLTDNTWPLIDGRFVPPASDLFAKTPFWANFTENITTIQFDHRMVAYLVLIVALTHAVLLWRRMGSGPATSRSIVLAALVVSQAVLGVVTLLLVVPLWAGLAHQGLALIVLAVATHHRRAMTRS